MVEKSSNPNIPSQGGQYLFFHEKRDSLQAELQIHYQRKCKEEQKWRDEDHHKDTLSIVIELYTQLQ